MRLLSTVGQFVANFGSALSMRACRQKMKTIPKKASRVRTQNNTRKQLVIYLHTNNDLDSENTLMFLFIINHDHDNQKRYHHITLYGYMVQVVIAPS